MKYKFFQYYDLKNFHLNNYFHLDDIIVYFEKDKLLKQLINIENIKVGEKLEKPEQSATAVIKNIEIFLPLKGLIDIKLELNRLESKINDLKARIDNVKKKLDNVSFVDKAPSHIVDHEKNKYNTYLEDYNKLLDNYNSIK